MPVAEVLYRLVEYIQLSIWERVGVDSFNIYQSTIDVGPYTLFTSTPNEGSNEFRTKGRILVSFNPKDFSWDNEATNYIKIAPVTGGVEGPLEGPVKILPLHYEKAISVDRMAMFVYDDVNQRYIPASTSMTAFH
jgi:hypothetical protein